MKTNSKNLESNPDDIKNIVLDVVCERINQRRVWRKNVSPSDIDYDGPLARYGFDSLDTAEVIIEVEGRTGIEPNMLKVARGCTDTASDLVDLFTGLR